MGASARLRVSVKQTRPDRQPRPSNWLSMRVLVYRTSSFEPLELSVDSDITIEALKKLLPESDTRAVADGARLIYGGLVLLDSSRLSELACDSEPLALWFLLDFIQDSMQVVTTAESLGLSLGIFPLSWAPPCQSQKSGGYLVVADFLAALHGFRKSLGAQASTTATTNTYLLESALALAIAALECQAPTFNSAPNVTWFGEYGCALLASELRVGVVQLRIVCLDGWTFRMHSKAGGGRSHTADAAADAASPVQIGEVPTAEYAGFMCALISNHTPGTTAKTHQCRSAWPQDPCDAAPLEGSAAQGR